MRRVNIQIASNKQINDVFNPRPLPAPIINKSKPASLRGTAGNELRVAAGNGFRVTEGNGPTHLHEKIFSHPNIDVVAVETKSAVL